MTHNINIQSTWMKKLLQIAEMIDFYAKIS